LIQETDRPAAAPFDVDVLECHFQACRDPVVLGCGEDDLAAVVAFVEGGYDCRRVVLLTPTGLHGAFLPAISEIDREAAGNGRF
jgi:hypothetical protein